MSEEGNDMPTRPKPATPAPADTEDQAVTAEPAADESTPEMSAKERRIRELEAELVADRRIAELEAELAAIRANALAQEQKKPPKNTHILLLANGESVVTSSPVATHHYSERDEATVPVVSVFELGEE